MSQRCEFVSQCLQALMEVELCTDRSAAGRAVCDAASEGPAENAADDAAGDAASEATGKEIGDGGRGIGIHAGDALACSSERWVGAEGAIAPAPTRGALAA